jgi:hypothetical protein
MKIYDDDFDSDSIASFLSTEYEDDEFICNDPWHSNPTGQPGGKCPTCGERT